MSFVTQAFGAVRSSVFHIPRYNFVRGSELD